MAELDPDLLPLGAFVDLDQATDDYSFGVGNALSQVEIAGVKSEWVVYPDDHSVVLHVGGATKPLASYRFDLKDVANDIERYITKQQRRKGGLLRG